ncbi:hypothetical protein TMEN_5067 [Trichophyton mentagrophytes]|nr:hypothetical protein TMEN_5067 [Trichophyton mentagrophytes]
MASSGDINISPLDHRIYQNGGLTTNIERLPSQLQATKSQLRVTTEEFIRENSRLREELAYYKSIQQALIIILERSKESIRLLQTTLSNVSYRNEASNAILKASHQVLLLLRDGLRRMSEKVTISEQRLLNYFGIALDDTRNEDIKII